MPSVFQSQGRPYSCDPYDIEPHLLLDLTKIKAELGYQDVVPLRTAMEKTVTWLCDQQPQEEATLDYQALDAVLDQVTQGLTGKQP